MAFRFEILRKNPITISRLRLAELSPDLWTNLYYDDQISGRKSQSSQIKTKH